MPYSGWQSKRGLAAPERELVAQRPGREPGAEHTAGRIGACEMCGTDRGTDRHTAGGKFPATPYPIMQDRAFAEAMIGVGPNQAITATAAKTAPVWLIARLATRTRSFSDCRREP